MMHLFKDKNNSYNNTFPIVIGIIAMLVFLFYIAFRKSLQADEAESFAGASLIFDGQVPYKDFWQIHTPLFLYFLSPLCFFFKSMRIIYADRFIVVLLLFFNGYLIYIITKEFFPKKAGLLGFLSYLVCLPVLNINARPDVLVAVFSNLSLLFLLWGRLQGKKAFFFSGFCAALAVLSKQSGSFCVLSIVIFFIIRSLMRKEEYWDKSIFSKERFNFKSYCFFAAGLFIPCEVFYVLLMHQGAFDAFIQCAVKNDFLNSFLFLKVESIHRYPFGPLKEIFWINLPIFLSVIMLLFYLKKHKELIDVKRRNAFALVLVFLAVAFVALFRILHAWEYELLLDCQYFVLLAVPFLFFAYEEVFKFFKRKNKEFPGIILNSGMLLCLCLPPVFHVYRSTTLDLPGSIKVYDQIISLTNKNDKCFSVVPVPFRPTVYYYHIGKILMESPASSAQVENMLIKEILNDRIVVIVPDNRYSEMKLLRSLIRRNYILYDRSFFVPGKQFDPKVSQKSDWSILVEGYYRIQAYPPGILLDGRPVTNGIVYFKKGRDDIYFLGNPPNEQCYCKVFYDLQANKK